MIGEFFGPARARRRFGARGGDGDSAAKTERMIPMSSPAKLTDRQRAILFEASKRKDRCLIAPKTLKRDPEGRGQLWKVFVSEIKAKSGMEDSATRRGNRPSVFVEIDRRRAESHPGR